MPAGTKAIAGHPAWRALEAHQRAIRDKHLRKLFADDPNRGVRMRAEAVGTYLDYQNSDL
jgi:glucose-6-phosphate isomerase